MSKRVNTLLLRKKILQIFIFLERIAAYLSAFASFSGSHDELLENPNGAYSQLIRLQEMNRESVSINRPDSKNSDVWVGSAGSSSKKMSMHRSNSLGSSGRYSRSNSFHLPFGLPISVDVPDKSENVDPERPAEQSKEVPLRRLAYLNKPEIPVLILGSVAAVVNGVIFPFYGVLLSNVINAFYERDPDKLKKDSNFWSLMFLIFGFISLLAIPARTYLFGVAGAKLIMRIRLMTFRKVVHREIEWFDNPGNSSGAIGARLSSDAASVRSLVGDALSLIVQNITTLIAGLVIAFVSNWQLSFIILALVPLLGLNGYVQLKFMQGFSKDAKVRTNTCTRSYNTV